MWVAVTNRKGSFADSQRHRASVTKCLRHPNPIFPNRFCPMSRPNNPIVVQAIALSIPRTLRRSSLQTVCAATQNLVTVRDLLPASRSSVSIWFKLKDGFQNNFLTSRASATTATAKPAPFFSLPMAPPLPLFPRPQFLPQSLHFSSTRSIDAEKVASARKSKLHSTNSKAKKLELRGCH